MQQGFAWDQKRLQFAVREPFPTRNTGTELVFGAITEYRPMSVESFMPENGVIFSDGIELDYLPFNSGCVITVGISKKKGMLVVG